MSDHKSHYRWFLKSDNRERVTSFMLFEKYGVDNCRIEEIEHLIFNNKRELLEREQHHIQTNMCVNKLNPIKRTPEEEKERARKWFEDRKEEHREITCECGDTYSYKHKSRHMQSAKHLAIINGTLPTEEEIEKKEADRKQRQKEWQAIKHTCECGGCYNNSNKSQHVKSQKHKTWMECNLPNIV